MVPADLDPLAATILAEAAAAPGIALLAGTFLAGLAFFFIGVDGIKQNLRQMTSRRFRAVMGRLASSGPLAAAWGLIFGAITQSATAVSFIMVGMMSSGLLPRRRALLVISWANAGTAALVFIAAIDIRAAILYLVGTSGLGVTLFGSRRWETLLRTLLSIGVLLLGLKFMGDAAKPLPEQAWFADLGEVVRRSGFGVFLLGAVLRLVIQSSSAIVIVGISLATAGVFEPEQILLLMFGTAVGVGGSVLLLSGSLRGGQRQLTLWQGIVNASVGLLLLGVYALEELTGVRWLRAIVAGGSPESLELRFALAFLLQQGSMAILGTLLLPASDRILARLAPASREEDLERLEFIHDATPEDPDTAVVLLEKEQQRLFDLLPEYLASVRGDRDGTAAATPGPRLLAASQRIGGEIRGLASELSEERLDGVLVDRLLQLQQRQDLVASLHESVCGFAAAASQPAPGEVAGRLRHNLVEGLDLIVGSLVEAKRSGDPMDAELLVGMTSDRGEMMERIRAVDLGGDRGVGVEVRANLLYMTTLFERSVWIAHRLARPLAGGVAVGSEAKE